jgi:phosphatidylglycerophosphate synthase
MPRSRPPLVIDARPRGPSGPLAGERVLGRSVLAHLVELAASLGAGPVTIHGRFDEHHELGALLSGVTADQVVLATGPPPEGSAVLRTDRLYDPARLRRALQRGREPEAAVIWRLDAPLGLLGAEDELVRRQTYQPLGRYWALAPARWLARVLCPTLVRPNTLTLGSGALMLGASAAIACGGAGLAVRTSIVLALAGALLLDTADGHLARLQGTSSEFGRWLDATLDELGDMALHAAAAWAAFARDGLVVWLLLGMLYGMGKYLFVVTSSGSAPSRASAGHDTGNSDGRIRLMRRLEEAVRLAGHADLRWHIWILLALCGRLDLALAAYAGYYPARAAAGAARKAWCRG